MVPMKHYFLSVDGKKLRLYSEQMNLLTGYVATRVSMKMDPEHGPIDPEGEILNTSYPILKEITDYMSDFLKDTYEAEMKLTRKKMAQDIINTIQNNSSGLDLLLKLQQILENYEIIGKRDFTRDEDGEEYYPF